MKSVEELSSFLKEIKEQIDSGRKYDEIAESTDVKKYLLSDIKRIGNAEKIEENIADFIDEINKGRNIKITAAKYGYGDKLTRFLISNLIDKDYKELKNYEYVLRIESMWRRYKAGENIYSISADCNMDVRVAETIIKNFNSSIEKRRKQFSAKKNITDEDIQRLKDKAEFSDDVIDYIVTGKEIDFKNNIMEDEGKDEL